MDQPRRDDQDGCMFGAHDSRIGVAAWDDGIVSLDDPENALLEAPPWSDARDPLEVLLDEEEREKLQEHLEQLPPELRRMVELHFGLADGRCHSIEEIAVEFGVTRERARLNILRGINYRVCVYPKRRAALKDFLED